MHASTLNLLELLDELGYLEGIPWVDKRDPEHQVQVVSFTPNEVTYGKPGHVQTAPIEVFLTWFQPRRTIRSGTSGGSTASAGTSWKS